MDPQTCFPNPINPRSGIFFNILNIVISLNERVLQKAVRENIDNTATDQSIILLTKEPLGLGHTPPASQAAFMDCGCL